MTGGLLLIIVLLGISLRSNKMSYPLYRLIVNLMRFLILTGFLGILFGVLIILTNEPLLFTGSPVAVTIVIFAIIFMFLISNWFLLHKLAKRKKRT